MGDDGETYYEAASRTVCYLSAEFLLGPHLENHLINLGLYDDVQQAVEALGLDFQALIDQEEEPGLGNGGLGRLAACYLDSLATLNIPAIGYGIRYEFGIFTQEIRDGWQEEVADQWLRMGNPWEVARPEIAYESRSAAIPKRFDDAGRYRVRWVPERRIRGVAYDTMITGYASPSVIMLRLFKAEATTSFDFAVVQRRRLLRRRPRQDRLGEPDQGPLSQRRAARRPPAPADAAVPLRLLRAAGHDPHLFPAGKGPARFHEKYAIQLNDTHPAIGVAELMRLLVDIHDIGWDEAWEITRKTFGYTNHTLLSEALKNGRSALRRSAPPSGDHLRDQPAFPGRRPQGPSGRRGPARRLSLIDEGGGRYVRMANLACVGSRRINGVARLHTDLLRHEVLNDFNRISPEKFLNVTNGVTPRRFLVLSNPALAALISECIGPAGSGPSAPGAGALAEDAAFRATVAGDQRRNKESWRR